MFFARTAAAVFPLKPLHPFVECRHTSPPTTIPNPVFPLLVIRLCRLWRRLFLGTFRNVMRHQNVRTLA